MADTPAQAAASVEASVSTVAVKTETELSFVVANWGKLSIIVVAAAVIGFLVRSCV